jgi:exonuclease III
VARWRLALWQPWRERRNEPALEPPPTTQQQLYTALATWNINGFWSKKAQIVDFLHKEKIAVCVLQETLVRATNYPIRVDGYSSYFVNAEEGFRGLAVLVDKRYSSFEIPHGLRWLTHVRVFGYAGVSGPTHIIGVYLKSGGNHRTTRREAFVKIAGLVAGILNRNPEDRIVVLGDLNCTRDKVALGLHRAHCNDMFLSYMRGSAWSRFPINGKPSDLDHILLSKKSFRTFLGARVSRQYNASDHRPVVIRPRAQLPVMTERKPRVKFDNKMISLKSDLVANDNAWTRLMTQAFGDDFIVNEGSERDRRVQHVLSENTDDFIKTFDQVCRRHSVKKEVSAESKARFPRKLKQLLQVVKRYSDKMAKASKKNLPQKEGDVTRLARATKRFKKAKREWEIRLKQKRYASVADDFVNQDLKGVWNRLNPEVKPNASSSLLVPVRDKEGVMKYRPEEILDVFKQHYEDLLTYDPDGLAQNDAHWGGMSFGDPKPMLFGLNDPLDWREILITIRGLNRNTAPGQDGIHVNVLKAMVLEESMAQLKATNPLYRRQDNLRVDLPADKLPKEPLTPLGKSFHVLLLNVWATTMIPPAWHTVEIVNLFKGGDPENTSNYRGISLISCAYKVLMAVMASRLSLACNEGDILAKEQAGFRKREEAVAQAIALAEIVRRRWMKGKPTYGLFVDFKKAYDRLYHGLLFRILDHVGVRGRFLDLIKSMYKETKCVVRLAGLTSDPFTPVRGAKQGDPLSPILFVIAINSVLNTASATGGVRAMPLLERCPGLLYADDVIALESKLTDIQRTLHGVWNWGIDYGMELGSDKCGVMLWPSSKDRQLRRKTVLDIESDCSSIDGVDPWNGYEMDDLVYQHDNNDYFTIDGVIPTVQHYKYLGITMDTRLGDSRKIITGARSMELDFAFLQAKKGLNILHSLRPFLTDRFCPLAIKVMVVRNLVYSKMLYGAEFIGFQQLHADPMQRVINLAAKWILGLSGSNTQTDAFTLCFELGLPPVHQELCAMRARLCFKLDAHLDGGLGTWIQDLWDNPPPVKHAMPLSWATTSRQWLKGLERERNKYNRVFVEDAAEGGSDPPDNLTVPLRPWAQLGKSCEFKVRSNPYASNPTGVQAMIRTAFLGETQFGEMVAPRPEAPLVLPELGVFKDVDFDFDLERERMDEGRTVPSGRDRGQVVKTAFVRDVVLERMMTSQRTKGFSFYDKFYMGITRGFIREAMSRPDLAEGVRWLSLTRCRGFPTIEGAWQRIKRSGQDPPFGRGECPLCSAPIILGWEWSHLLLNCVHPSVASARLNQLGPNIVYLRTNLLGRGGRPFRDILNDTGLERQTDIIAGVLSIYLVGGLIRPLDSTDREGWWDVYQLGFGHLKILTPSLEVFSFVPVASFLQIVAPLYLLRLGGDPYKDDASASLSVSSSVESVNQDQDLEGTAITPPRDALSSSPEVGQDPMDLDL